VTDWIFQANPKRYDVHAAVVRSTDDSWNTPIHRDTVAVGDRVWLSIVGPVSPGLYYIAEITSLPYEKPESEFGRWHSDIRYVYRIEPPLLRAELVADPALGNVRLLRGFQGSNALLPADVAQRLEELVSGRLRALGGTQGPALGPQLDVNLAVEHHNRQVRQELKTAIEALSPTQFELLVVGPGGVGL
jgi:hypothetical protein